MNQITASEMELINSYSRIELTPDDVYVFTVKLCDNDLDCDNERFTVESLFVLAKLFVGKTGIVDYDPSANNQMMRIIACKVEYVEDKVTAVGEPYYRLMARVYLLRNDNTKELIDNIEEGIADEVSIGCSVRRSTCSICHNDIRSPLCGHQRGEKYGVMGRAKLCFVELQEPTDAYEFAFVARPKIRNIELRGRRMKLYHVTTNKKAKQYHQSGCIHKPVRGFTNLQSAMAWAIKTGRTVIYEIEGDPAYKLPDHHNIFGEAWWIDKNIPIKDIRCVFSAEKDA